MASEDPRKYDNTFYSMIQHEGNIDGFLDAVFGFLYRGTDFYRIMKTKQDKMGFPPGVAERKALKHFRKYEKMAREDDEETERKRKKSMKTEQPLPAPPAVREEVVIDDVSDSELARIPEKPPEQSNVVESQVGQAVNGREKPAIKDAPPAAAAATDGEEDDPELSKLQKEFQSMPETYNGADRGKYLWSQSITDCDLRVRIPQFITKGRDVQVKTERKHIKVSAKDNSGAWEVLVDDELKWEINLEKTLWSMVPHEYVHVCMEKVKERWWEAVFINEPHISVRKIDPSRPITDLDQEAQAKIEELMYNEHQKRLGKPQSHEVKVHEMLKKAWDIEGSPFKGTPFDPTKLNVTPPGGS